MVINPNAGLDVSQVEDLRNDAAKLSGLADLPDDSAEETDEDSEEEPGEQK
jgi:hypothetical protein